MNQKTVYRQFCQQNPNLPVFVQDWYLDSTCLEGHWDAAILTKEEKIIGVWPYFLKQKGPFRYITMPPLTKFMGPYLLPEFQQRDNDFSYYSQLYKALPQVHSFTQNFFYESTTEASPSMKDFAFQNFYSYRLEDISDLDQVHAGVARYYRNTLLKNAPKILTIRHDLGVAAYYEINRKTYARQEMEIPFSLELLRSNVAALEKNKSGKVFFAVDAEGRIHAAALLIWDQTTAYYHSAGGDPELRKSGAGIYVVWEMIRFASTVLGLSHFDFAGSMIAPIEKLWKNFGAQRKEYFHVEKHGVLFSLAQRLKR